MIRHNLTNVSKHLSPCCTYNIHQVVSGAPPLRESQYPLKKPLTFIGVILEIIGSPV